MRNKPSRRYSGHVPSEYGDDIRRDSRIERYPFGEGELVEMRALLVAIILGILLIEFA